jgi:hypothetical protein
MVANGENEPTIYPAVEMEKMAQSAAQVALNQAAATGSTGLMTVNVGGLKWKVAVNPSTVVPGGLNVSTAYPVGAATWP